MVFTFTANTEVTEHSSCPSTLPKWTAVNVSGSDMRNQRRSTLKSLDHFGLGNLSRGSSLEGNSGGKAKQNKSKFVPPP